MKKSIILMTTLLLVACGNDTVVVPKPPDYDARISLVEARLALNEANDSLLEARVAALEGRMTLAESLIVDLRSDVDILLGRIQTLETRQDATDTEITNLVTDLSSITSQIQSINNLISNMVTQQELADVVSVVNSSIATQISTVNSQLATLDSRLDALEGSQTKVLACKRSDNSLSAERFIKISGKLYAVMNHVTLSTVNVVTGSTSQSVDIPCVVQSGGGSSSLKFCSNTHKYDTVVIPANTTTPVSVVSGVQVALEQLTSGQSYVTTDGTASCSFNGNGSNLVEVQ